MERSRIVTIVGVVFLFFSILIVLSNILVAIPMPVGVGGKILKNDTPAVGLSVLVENYNTGEKYIKTVNDKGYYVCGLPAKDNDKIILTIGYEGKTYTNYTFVDTNRATQWLNLSFFYEKPTENPATPPPNIPSSPPIATFTYIPKIPIENETVYFTDTSQEGTSKITNWEWLIDGKKIDTHHMTYVFKECGNYPVSLKVTDEQGLHDGMMYTIPVAKNNTGTSDETDNDTTEKIENITIHIFAQEKNIEINIYQNNTLVHTLYTNETGWTSITLPKDTYLIKCNENSKIVDADSQVVFLLGTDNVAKPQSSSIFSVELLIAVIVIISISALSIAYYKGWGS